MRYYIECYHKDGTQRLGNLDGQASLNVINYKRTNAYKRILTIVKNPNHMNGIVDRAHIVNERGRVLEVIK
jgi:hypothetical protein